MAGSLPVTNKGLGDSNRTRSGTPTASLPTGPVTYAVKITKSQGSVTNEIAQVGYSSGVPSTSASFAYVDSVMTTVTSGRLEFRSRLVPPQHVPLQAPLLPRHRLGASSQPRYLNYAHAVLHSSFLGYQDFIRLPTSLLSATNYSPFLWGSYGVYSVLLVDLLPFQSSASIHQNCRQARIQMVTILRTKRLLRFKARAKQCRAWFLHQLQRRQLDAWSCH